MTDTAQIVGNALILLFMLLAIYGIECKKELGKSIWLMVNALLVGMVIF